MLRLLLTIWLLLGLVNGVIINENVVFHKANDVTLSRAKWLGNFVIDLNPFEKLLAELKADINTVVQTSQYIEGAYDKAKLPEYENTFQTLTREIDYLEILRNTVVDGLTDINSIHSSRQKRSLFPLLGKAASWIFGLLSEDDISNIKKHVSTLQINQNKILHVVKESISILNEAKLEIYENRPYRECSADG